MIRNETERRKSERVSVKEKRFGTTPILFSSLSLECRA